MHENEREAKNLRAVFGETAICDILAHHAYAFQEKCEEMRRGLKGNKEINLFGAILSRTVRLGIIDVNRLTNFEKLPGLQHCGKAEKCLNALASARWCKRASGPSPG